MLALDEHSAVRCAQTAGSRRRADSAPLTVLAGDALDGRFRCWRGRSGRRYVFSVYNSISCPAYEHAVLMVAATTPDGERRILSIVETGCFPDIALAKAAATTSGDGALEFHIHLLARSPAERSKLIGDLGHRC